MKPRPVRDAPIALLSDFGTRDHYAGVMRGVIATIAPAARVIDITHGIPAQSVIAGSLALRESWRFFPPATIFVAVVDPGVGTSRRPILIETRAEGFLIGPDNGVLWLAAEQAGVKRIIELTSSALRLSPVSPSFHGRDVFAPAAAHLWRGVPVARFGPPLNKIEEISLGTVSQQGQTLSGKVIYVDNFGNLITNISSDRLAAFRAFFPSKTLFVTIDDSAPMELHSSYAQASGGSPLALFGSFDLLEVAVRDGNGAAYFAAAEGAIVKVSVKSN